MARPDSSAQHVMRSHCAPAHFRHEQGGRRSLATEHVQGWKAPGAMVDLPGMPQESGAEVIGRLLQQALVGAQQMQGAPNHRVVEHIRLALSAHAEASTQVLAPVWPLRASGGLAAWQAAVAEKLILEKLDAQVLTATLAQACSLSRGHFSRLFKKTFGLPPHKWQRERRLDMAKRLLCDPRCALADIAISCGFNDQAHFTRVFKLMTKRTPVAWRRLASGAPGAS